MNWYTLFIKPILFTVNPEIVHEKAVQLGSFIARFTWIRKIYSYLFRYSHPMLRQDYFRLSFSTPVGLGAGFDYNINLYNLLYETGFSFFSGGTVTYLPYEGNHRPRLVRLPKSQSILVNKGFKSDGIVQVLGNLRSHHKNSKSVAGISIGATNIVLNDTAEKQVIDIINSLTFLKQHGTYSLFSYVEINISCPNTKKVDALYNPIILDSLLTQARMIIDDKPIFIKLPLEVSWEVLEVIMTVIINHDIDAVIVANLKKNRTNAVLDSTELTSIRDRKGNLSGKPTSRESTLLIAKMYQHYGDHIRIIGMGGISTAEEAYEKICAGASLVQLVTGLIYEGPSISRRINKGLVRYLKRDGFTTIQEAIGSAHR